MFHKKFALQTNILYNDNKTTGEINGSKKF